MRSVPVFVASLVVALPALAADTPATYTQAVLRDGCAQAYASHSALAPADGQAPAFSGERYKGDNRYYNDAKPCTEEHYALYLQKADPAMVAMAYPTAAGKPKVKKPAGSASAPAKPK
jgi:hypothetical protein